MKNKSKGCNFCRLDQLASLFRAKNKILEPIWSFTMKKGSLLERLPSSDASEFPLAHVTDHDVPIMDDGQVWIHDVGVSSVLVSGWRLLGPQVVTSLLSQVQVCFPNLKKVFLNSRSCTYPGAVIHGTINPVMFYYKVSQTVTYKCSEVIREGFKNKKK